MQNNSATSPRLRALDMARGLCLVLMLLVNFPGSSKTIYSPLQHAVWDGFTLADLVFPWFLFLIGVSSSLVHTRQKPLSKSISLTLRKGFIRGSKLLLAGYALSILGRLQFGFSFGTLERIGIAYILSLPFLVMTTRKLAVSVLTINVIQYLCLCLWLAPGTTWDQRFLQHHTLAEFVDLVVLGRSKAILFSFFGAVSCILLGELIGRFLFKEPLSNSTLRKIAALAIAVSGICLVVGAPQFLQHAWYVPLIARLWGPSLMFFASAIMTFILVVFIYLERIRAQIVFNPFVVMGENSLAVYLGTDLFDVILSDHGARLFTIEPRSFRSHFYQELSNYMPVAPASTLVAVVMLLIGFTIAYALRRREIIVKF